MYLFLLSLIIYCSSSQADKADKVRLVVGGALQYTSPVLDYYGNASNVVYITAAGSNPSGDAKSIGDFFKKRGISATWIPVYGSNCKSRTQDQQYIDMVKKADALYFSGGKSGYLQECLFGGKQSGDTALLKAIRELPLVGGSSAGAMIQPVLDILITGSSSASYEAVRDKKVYYRPHGNAFIKSGLVDVHFSERGRQGRLLVLAVNTKTSWAYGIDENTAFKVGADGGEIEVIGQSGVVIFQDAVDMKNAKMHYLTHGDKISQTGEISFAPEKKACPLTTAPKSSNKIFSGTNFRSISGKVARYSSKLRLVNHHGSSPAVEVVFDNTGVRTVCDSKGLVSFADMHVSMGSSKDYVNPEVYPTDDQLWMLDV